MARKITESKALSYALFLIGLVMLIESASTVFVLLEAPMVDATVAWIYTIIKALVSLYVLFVGFGMMKK